MVLFAGLKRFIVGALVSTVFVVGSVIPVYAEQGVLKFNSSIASPELISKVKFLRAERAKYIDVQGKFSYLNKSVVYLFLVPKEGGSFKGTVEGTCQAMVTGEYEGGNGGKISGDASGQCKFMGLKYVGLTHFTGKLYPNRKTIEIEVDYFPINPITINYY